MVMLFLSSNVIEVYICSLRRKLGANFIQTLRRQGYRLCELKRAGL
ncbi:TPA: winged helix-turn-helix domain-containing protein [Salmonella enterica subsp. enterica serovar Muenchen]